jgi:hypothetical protein
MVNSQLPILIRAEEWVNVFARMKIENWELSIDQISPVSFEPGLFFTRGLHLP